MSKSQGNLSDRLQKRVGQYTKTKTDGLGNKVGGHTKITQGLVDSVRGDEENLEVIADNTEEVLRRIGGALAAALEECGLAGERFAKAECPVDTGRLRNSITHAVDADEKDVYIGTNVEYAPYVENGARGREGKYFLRHAAADHAQYYRNVMKKHLENG